MSKKVVKVTDIAKSPNEQLLRMTRKDLAPLPSIDEGNGDQDALRSLTEKQKENLRTRLAMFDVCY